MTAQEVTNHAQLCLQISQNLTNYRTAKAGELSQSEDKSLDSRQNNLLDLATELNAKAVLIRIEDLTDAVNQVNRATERIKQAIDKLEKTKKIIGAIAGLINLVTSIMTAVTTGNPAKIASALDEIKNFV